MNIRRNLNIALRVARAKEAENGAGAVKSAKACIKGLYSMLLLEVMHAVYAKSGS